MSDSTKHNESEITEQSDQSLSANQTEVMSEELRKLEVSLSPFGKLAVDLDSDSSGDELTAFDRVRVLSDSEESDTDKKVQETPVPSEPPADPLTPDPVSTPAPEPRETVTSSEDKQDDTPAESETKEDTDSPHLPITSVTSPVSEQSENKSEDTVLESTDNDLDTSKSEQNKTLPVEPEDKPTSPERSSSQTKEVRAETEKGRKYPQNRDFSRERGGRWKNNNEDSYRDGNRRERGKGRSYRDDRGKREDFTSYGHDDRFYFNLDQRPKDLEDDPGMFQQHPPVRIWKGSRGRGEEGKWKHDKFNEDEQGPIDVEPNYNNSHAYSPPQSVGQNHYSEKKGRGRGDRKQQQQYDVQSPAPGFTRNSPRQERRGRGSRPRRDDYDRISVSTCSKGRGNSNRYNSGYYNNDSESMYLSKPIVFVSQNKRSQSPGERESTYSSKTTLSSSDIIRIGESEYIQSSASTPLPTIPVISSRTKIESDLKYSNNSDRTGQKKYGPYNSLDSDRSKPVTISPYVGLGRGKGKLLAQVALLQGGQEYKKPNETVKLQYGKENISKNDLNEAFPLSNESAVSSPYKDKPQHKPQRYSTQRLKQGHSTSASTVAAANKVVDPNSKLGLPTSNLESNSSKQKSPPTQEQGTTVPIRLGERAQPEGHHSLMEVPYSEFYPSPFKEEMFGNQMSPMHPYNVMPDGTILQDFMLPPEVMKEGDFQHMQFPPFMPQEMAMNMKGSHNMMGGPFMGNPQLGQEYMMPNEVPPNMQTDLFVPMQSYYPPI